MTKWPRFGSCKTRLSKDIGKNNALRIQKRMLNHTISVSNYIKEQEIAEISIAITGIGLNSTKRWCKVLGINNFYFQGKGCLGEKMKRQIFKSRRNSTKYHKKNIIFIGTDLPNLSHMDIVNTISKLEKKDVIIGPSNDGGYWLIAFSQRLISINNYLPFINIKWSSNDVLKRTIDNLSQQKVKIDFLNTKIDIDTVFDIDQRG
tara:strand:- start:869 stop:1480 length:612 start_codon:yes stop_codon:yes gene_type:complete